MFKLKTPVAFLIFNRPETTKMVFNEIRKVKPEKLFVIADGPREDYPDDKKKCQEARSIIQVDWDCEVLYNYSDVNLGCGKRPYTGISWVFEQVENAIILEDDCVPHPTFFQFCQELLEKYRDDERIMIISGDNFQFGRNITDDSYYFSRYSHIWGWATWRRVWKNYDFEIKSWPEVLKSNLLENWFNQKKHITYWKNIFQRVYTDTNKSYWDYQLVFSCWSQNGLSIIPSVNLVTNIGYGSNATHTIKKNKFANIPYNEIVFPLRHPSYFIRNYYADDYTQKQHFSKPPFHIRVINKLKDLIMWKG